MSVGFHLVAYNGRDDKLFRAAIMQSGSSVQPGPVHNAAHFDDQYQAVVDLANCTGALDALDCLRKAPFGVINAAINTTNITAWHPVLDGDLVSGYGSQLLEAGDYVHVPIISGANNDEGALLGPTGINTSDQFLAYLEGEATFSAEDNLTDVVWHMIEGSDSGYITFPPLSAENAELILKAYPDDPCEGIPTDLGCTRLEDFHGLK